MTWGKGGGQEISMSGKQQSQGLGLIGILNTVISSIYRMKSRCRKNLHLFLMTKPHNSLELFHKYIGRLPNIEAGCD